MMDDWENLYRHNQPQLHGGPRYMVEPHFEEAGRLLHHPYEDNVYRDGYTNGPFNQVMNRHSYSGPGSEYGPYVGTSLFDNIGPDTYSEPRRENLPQNDDNEEQYFSPHSPEYMTSHGTGPNTFNGPFYRHRPSWFGEQ